jgi:hypothetical protein
MNIKIFVAYHSECQILQNEIYIPIQVGRSNAKSLLNMIGDDTGENISKKNQIYSEMTALYWIWKNFEDYDYIGLCHYRRFFTFDCNFILDIKKYILYAYSKLIGSWHSGFNFIKDSAYILNKIEAIEVKNNFFTNQIIKEIDNYDIFTLYPTKFSGMDIKTLFSQPSGIYHIKVIESIIAEKYPEFLIPFQKQCKSNKLYPANMSIMHKNTFKQYAKFIFDILEAHERFCIKDSWCIDPLTEKSFFRLSGYLSEILTSTYINYCKNEEKLRIKHLHQIFFQP